MPFNSNDFNTEKEFNWEACQSIERLKQYIKNSQLFEVYKSPEQRELDSLKHDLAVREGYEKACEKVQNELVQVFSLARRENEAVLPGTQIEYPTDGFWDHPNGIILLNKAVEQNIEKLKPVMEKWLEQELQTEKQKLNHYLNSRQEKVRQEISLIKEVLND
jgi:hypothetical protein